MLFFQKLKHEFIRFLYFLYFKRYNNFDQDFTFEDFLLNENIKIVICVFCQLKMTFNRRSLYSSFRSFFPVFLLIFFSFSGLISALQDQLLLQEVNEDLLLFFRNFSSLLDIVSKLFL